MNLFVPIGSFIILFVVSLHLQTHTFNANKGQDALVCIISGLWSNILGKI